MNMPASLAESRKTIAQNFKESYGVSIQDCVAKPSLLVKLFGSLSVTKGNTSSDGGRSFGRGYPFWQEPRSSAEEADRKNIEILSKW